MAPLQVGLVKSLTTDKLDLAAQLVGGFGAVLVILFGWCSWQIALAWMGVVPVMGVIGSVQVAKPRWRHVCRL